MKSIVVGLKLSQKLDDIQSELVRIYARNHYYMISFLPIPLLTFASLYVYFYPPKSMMEYLVLLFATSFGIFSVFLQRVFFQTLLFKSTSDRKPRKSKISFNEVVICMVLKTVTNLILLSIAFNLILPYQYFYNSIFGYLVAFYMLIYYSSTSAAYAPLLIIEMALTSGISGIYGLTHIEYKENIYMLLLLGLSTFIAGVMSYRNWSTSNSLLIQKKQTQEAMEKVTRTERAKSELMATISHEIRTPLNGIMGMVQVLLDSDGLPQEQKDKIDIIYKCSNTLLNTINDVLDLSKLEAGKFSIHKSAFDINSILNNVYQLMAPRAKQKGLDFILDVSPQAPIHIFTDPNRIQQIITNFISNAIKFTDSGMVKISVNTNDSQTPHLVFEVTDTGPGIAEDIQAQLFSDYTQADSSIANKYGGTGLGLSISKKLATLLGGDVGLRSQPGQGSTFWLEVPFEIPDALQDHQDIELNQTIKQIDIKILAAEDNPINQTILTSFFEKYGIEYVIASNGREAVDLLASSKFDLILMDMEMPVLSGIEATREIVTHYGRGNFPPIIGLSGNVLSEQIQQCRDAGMVDHVAKPIDFPTLINKISTYAPHNRIFIHDQIVSQKNEPRNNLSELEKIMGKDYVLTFIGEAIQNISQLYASMQEAIVGLNLKEVKALAHDIKSISGTIDANEANQIAAEIELIASEGKESKIWRVVELNTLLHDYIQATKLNWQQQAFPRTSREQFDLA